MRCGMGRRLVARFLFSHACLAFAVSATDLFAAAPSFASLTAPLEIYESEPLLEDSSLDECIWRTRSRTSGALGAHTAAVDDAVDDCEPKLIIGSVAVE